MVTTTAQRKDPDAPPAWRVTDAAFRRNPYPRYAELREDDVLHRNADLWVLTRFADVQAVLRDQRMSSHPRHTPPEVIAQRLAAMGDGVLSGGPSALADRGIELMLVADPPDHTRLRRLATKAFTPRAVERLRPRITQIVDGMVDAARERGTLDVMHDIAEPLPVMVICDLLGVPLDDQAQFKPWSSAIARVVDGDVNQEMLMEAMPAILGFVQYFNGLIDLRRADPRDDLVSALVAAEEDGDSLTHGELLAMIILLFIAGHETTTNLIGNGTLALLRHPDQLAALRANPALAGPGTCLGAPLARLEGQVVFHALATRTASLDLLDDDPPYRDHFVLRGLSALPVAVF